MKTRILLVMVTLFVDGGCMSAPSPAPNVSDVDAGIVSKDDAQQSEYSEYEESVGECDQGVAADESISPEDAGQDFAYEFDAVEVAVEAVDSGADEDAGVEPDADAVSDSDASDAVVAEAEFISIDGTPDSKDAGAENLNEADTLPELSADAELEAEAVDLCKGVDCDDDNFCTIDSCDPATGDCVHLAAVVCNDDNLCTDDSCDPASGCVYTSVNCDDDNFCTDDSCDSAMGCMHADNPASCDDGDKCTVEDVCFKGKCVGGSTLNCDDNNLCTDDSCDPATGDCVHLSAVVCDDDNLCTNDACDPAVGCVFTLKVCDDQSACTTNACDPAAGCVFTPVDCDNGNVCDGLETCDSATGCKAGVKLDCDDNNVCTFDICVPGTGCTHLFNTNKCDDDNKCTTGDECKDGVCAGATVNCDDSNYCTNDSCDLATGCVNASIPGCCVDDLDCDGIFNAVDNCPNDSNPGQEDMDKDGTGDACDPVNSCKLSADGLPAEFYVHVPPCLNGCFVKGQLMCIACVVTNDNYCEVSHEGDGTSICEGDCNDGSLGQTFQCWPGNQAPPVCKNTQWTPQ